MLISSLVCCLFVFLSHPFISQAVFQKLFCEVFPWASPLLHTFTHNNPSQAKREKGMKKTKTLGIICFKKGR